MGFETNGHVKRTMEVESRMRMYVFIVPRTWSARRAGIMRPGIPALLRRRRMVREEVLGMWSAEVVKSRICV